MVHPSGFFFFLQQGPESVMFPFIRILQPWPSWQLYPAYLRNEFFLSLSLLSVVLNMCHVTLHHTLLPQCITPILIFSPELCLYFTFHCLSLREPLAGSIFKLSSTQATEDLLIPAFLPDLLCSLIVIQLKSRRNIRLRATSPDQVLAPVLQC